MRNTLFLLLLSALMSCSNATMQEELKRIENELATSNATIEDLKSQIEPEGNLVHVVLFKLKPDADLDAVIAEVKKLESIEGVKDLEVGLFEDLGDDRALSDYNMMMEMSFDDAEAYRKYQAHPVHLALKGNIKSMLAGPPATYDYMKR